MDALPSNARGRPDGQASLNNPSDAIINQLRYQLAEKTRAVAAYAEENRALKNTVAKHEATIESQVQRLSALETPEPQRVEQLPLERGRPKSPAQLQNVAGTLHDKPQYTDIFLSRLKIERLEKQNMEVQTHVKDLEIRLATSQANMKKDRDAINARFCSLSKKLFGLSTSCSRWVPYIHNSTQLTPKKGDPKPDEILLWSVKALGTGHNKALAPSVVSVASLVAGGEIALFGLKAAVDIQAGNPLASIRVFELLSCVNKKLADCDEAPTKLLSDMALILVRHASLYRGSKNGQHPTVLASMMALLIAMNFLFRRFGVTTMQEPRNQLEGILNNTSGIPSLTRLVLGGQCQLQSDENSHRQRLGDSFDRKKLVYVWNGKDTRYALKVNFSTREIIIEARE